MNQIEQNIAAVENAIAKLKGHCVCMEFVDLGMSYQIRLAPPFLYSFPDAGRFLFCNYTNRNFGKVKALTALYDACEYAWNYDKIDRPAAEWPPQVTRHLC